MSFTTYAMMTANSPARLLAFVGTEATNATARTLYTIEQEMATRIEVMKRDYGRESDYV